MKKFVPTFLYQLLMVFTVFAQAMESSLDNILLKSNAQNPSQYIVNHFKESDVVLLGEDHGIKQNLEFVIQLIPSLYENGIYFIGMEFGAYEMQSKLDSMLVSENYDENLAREMMYFYNAGWAYIEYMDIYKAVWLFNSALGKDQKKFRILNLSYQYHWGEFKGMVRTPEMMKKVFWRGTIDKFRSEIIEKEILERSEKILVVAGLPHTFSKFNPCSLNFNNDSFCQYDNNWLGNRLYKKYHDRIKTILFHQPFQNYPNESIPLISPANGEIERLMKLNNFESIGFDLANSPIGELPDNSIYSMGYENFTIGQMADGYIFLVPINKMQGCSIDYAFFQDKNWESIKPHIPDPDWRGGINSLDEFWKQIEDFTDLKKRYQALNK